MNISKMNYYLVFICSCLFLSGCQPKVYLMPSPAGLQHDSEVFTLTKEGIHANLLYTFYATNRQPIDTDNKSMKYSIFPSKTLRMGFTVHSVGPEGMSWDDILEESMRSKRNSDLLLKNVHTKEIALFDLLDEQEPLSSQAYGLFDSINSALEKAFIKDIIVYVHGANSNFYRATAQGAQFFHFTGHNAIIVNFSWPSAENLLKYKTDVAHAKKTIPAFARLIELLAAYTDAQHIDILAYSAGVQVAAPGLAYLREKHPQIPTDELNKKLRIGNVYLASPDVAFEPFVDRYVKFRDIVQRTTINLNENDAVLTLSSFQNGVSRLGRPDLSELSGEEANIMFEEMQTPSLNIIDIGDSTPLHIGRAHDSWYSHPWVSADVLMLLFFNLDPLERGLKENWVDGGAKTYIFPEDYDLTVEQIFDRNRALIKERTGR